MRRQRRHRRARPRGRVTRPPCDAATLVAALALMQDSAARAPSWIAVCIGMDRIVDAPAIAPTTAHATVITTHRARQRTPVLSCGDASLIAFVVTLLIAAFAHVSRFPPHAWR